MKDEVFITGDRVYPIARTVRGGILSSIGRYFYNVVLALDQLGNTLAAGSPDETISGRLSRDEILPLLGPVLAAVLNAIDKGHTTGSSEYDDFGLPAPHHLPPLGRAALESVMGSGDDYLGLSAALLKMAEENALLQRMREAGLSACYTCGRYL